MAYLPHPIVYLPPVVYHPNADTTNTVWRPAPPPPPPPVTHPPVILEIPPPPIRVTPTAPQQPLRFVPPPPPPPPPPPVQVTPPQPFHFITPPPPPPHPFHFIPPPPPPPPPAHPVSAMPSRGQAPRPVERHGWLWQKLHQSGPPMAGKSDQTKPSSPSVFDNKGQVGRTTPETATDRGQAIIDLYQAGSDLYKLSREEFEVKYGRLGATTDRMTLEEYKAFSKYLVDHGYVPEVKEGDVMDEVYEPHGVEGRFVQTERHGPADTIRQLKESMQNAVDQTTSQGLSSAGLAGKGSASQGIVPALGAAERVPSKGPGSEDVKLPRATIEPSIGARAYADRPSIAARREFAKLEPVWAEKLGVGPDGVVHHARELQLLDKYPGVYTQDELNAFKNMRGIPAKYTDALHYGAIREEWNQGYEGLNSLIAERKLSPGTPEYNKLVRDVVEKGVSKIDDTYGHFFTDYGKVLNK